MTTDVTATRTARFWQQKYDDGLTGWDLGGAHPALSAALESGLLDGLDRVLVPGAGRGHDAVELAVRGHDVTAVDFAPSAIEAVEANASARNVVVRTETRDLFSLFDRPGGSFDAVFEYTCFCAIDPAMRDDYVRLVTHLVRPGGRLMMFAFPLNWSRPGPPHGMSLDELRTRFGAGWFEVTTDQPACSPEPRRDHERLWVIERCR
jgi:cyclopropane fatty-acyl-phospholipid synthase-like methyltransferase